ncbi:hypothetical protein JW721_02235 [Candidatus Micrarchaeota archaeon]|nr:hypothetical protein [Candidatus Micrarchaeota archaeon]
MDVRLFYILLAFPLLLFPGCLGGGDDVSPSEEGPSISVDNWIAEVEASNASGTGEEAVEAGEDWAALALAENDPSYCLKLPASERDACVLPLSNDSLPNCLQLVSYELKEGCLEHLAYETENISICDLMVDEARALCVEALSPPCTFVLETEEKARCMAFEYQNYSYCRSDQCFLDYAFNFYNKEACAFIDSEPKMEGCTSALTYKDGCRELEGSNKELCYYIYALGDKTPRFCYYIDGKYDSEIAFECFTHYAIENGEPSLCSALLVTRQWECYTDYALESGDKGGCYAIDTRAPTSREDCFEQYAYAYDDLLACNEIETLYVRQICYSALIFGSGDLSFAECNGITLPEWKDKCFQELAKQEDTLTYCNYIKSQAVKDNCIAFFYQ